MFLAITTRLVYGHYENHGTIIQTSCSYNIQRINIARLLQTKILMAIIADMVIITIFAVYIPQISYRCVIITFKEKQAANMSISVALIQNDEKKQIWLLWLTNKWFICR